MAVNETDAREDRKGEDFQAKASKTDERRERHMEYAEMLGSILFHKRRHLGITQQQLAKLSNVHTNTIYNWERGSGLQPVVAFLRALENCGVTIKVVADPEDADHYRFLADRRLSVLD